MPKDVNGGGRRQPPGTSHDSPAEPYEPYEPAETAETYAPAAPAEPAEPAGLAESDKSTAPAEPTGPPDATGPAPAGRRRRGAALEDALLQAAWEELLAVGYHALTYEAVAARAHTSRTVLYRRWPQRLDLVLAALGRQAPPLPPPPPDTGALRSDVLALLHSATAQMTEMTPVLQAVTDARARDSDLSRFVEERTYQAGREAMEAALDRAAQRGELDPSRLPARVIALPFTLVVGEVLLTHRAPSPATVAEVVDQVFLPLVHHYC
ncbi:TetR/AcrR family transcriptional regulator [Streptomyces sp. NPDC015125]|uniref:TetR/AcrR family transcriptional regulator n=1 Tax=Streptomyces sp. NPDC015125 TaxID=3364938 RepID=UPI0036FBCC60